MRINSKHIQHALNFHSPSTKPRPNAISGFNGYSRSKRRELQSIRNIDRRQSKRAITRAVLAEGLADLV